MLSGDVTDLDLDPAFYGGGLGSYWPASEPLSEEFGLAVAPIPYFIPPNFGVHFLALARHEYHPTGSTDSRWAAMIVRTTHDGHPVQAWGNNGQMLVRTGMNVMDHAAVEITTGRVFFVGSRIHSGWDWDMWVHCVDINVANGACDGWGSGSARRIAFDVGGDKFDRAQQVIVDPDGYIFVAGRVETNSGIELGVAKLHTATGLPAIGFGVNGRFQVNPSGRNNGRNHNAFAIALSGDTGLGWKKLYVAGNYLSTTGDYDGYVSAFSASTGMVVRHRGVYWENDNAGYKHDAVTAMTVLANGKVAIAGFSDTDNADYPSLLLGRFEEDLDWDLSFCGGVPYCIYPQTASPGQLATRDIRPRAMGERPENRDVVLALDGLQQDSAGSGGAFKPRQLVQQYSASGRTRRASTRNVFAASGAANEHAWARGIWIFNGPVLTVGTRRWSATDRDLTLSMHLSNDSIFADKFGGPKSD